MADDCTTLQASQPRSTAAFFRWREAGIRANFKRQLQDILQSISSEDVSIQQLQHELGIARAREHDLLHKLSQLKGELTATVAQLLEQQAHAADLQTVIDSYDAQVLAPLAQRLTNAEDRSAAHLQQHQRAHEAHQQALQGLKEENLRLLQEQHQLLDAMADKDVQASHLSTELLAAKEAATAAQCKLTAMEGVVRATGEQAAAAQDAAHESSRTVTQLQQQLADLKDKLHAALSQMQPLQAAASESGALKQRLQESSAAAAALAAAQLELKAALCEAHAGLAAATERCRMLEGMQNRHNARAQATAGSDDKEDSLASALAQQLEAAQAQLCHLSPQLAAAELTVQQQRGQIEQLAGELQQARAALVVPEQLVQEGQVVSGSTDWAAVLAQHADQLQQQVDAMQAVLSSSCGATQQQLPWHTEALSTVAHAAEVLCSTIRLLQQQQQQLPLTHTAAEALMGKVEAAVQRLNQQQQSLPLQLQQGVGKEHHQMWQQQVLSVFEEAGDALLAARQACSHSAEAGAAEAAAEMLAAVDDLLGELLAAAPDPCSKSGRSDKDNTHQAGSRAPHQEDPTAAALATSGGAAAAAAAVQHVQDALQDVASHLAAVTGSAAAGGDLDAAELHREGLDDLAGSIVAAEALIRDKTKVVGSPGVSAASSTMPDAPAVLGQLQPAQAALFAAIDRMQQLLGQLPAALSGRSSHGSPAKQAPRHAAKTVAQGAGGGAGGSGRLVPVELLEATRARLEQAEGQVVALQQEMRKQAAAQQEVAALYVDRATQLRSRHLLRRGLLQWKVVAAHGKARELSLQLGDGQATTQQYSERVTRQAENLAAYLKRKCRAQAAAAQQQQLAAAVRAWRQQTALQQGATWSWRWLAQQLLQLHPRAATCSGLCCCEQMPFEAELSQQLQQQVAAVDVLQSQRSNELSALTSEGPAQQGQEQGQRQGEESVNSPTQGAKPAAAAQQDATGSGGCIQGDQPPAQAGIASNPSDSGQHRCRCGSNSYMRRLMQRKQSPQGSVLQAAAAVKLQAAAFRAWHMLASLQGAVARVEQAEQQLEALSSGLPAWVDLLGARRRLERAWLGWRLAAVRGAAAQQLPQPQQQQQQQPRSGPVTAAGKARTVHGVTKAASRRGTQEYQLPAAGGVLAGQGPATGPEQQQQQSAGLLGMLAGRPCWQVKIGSAAGLQALIALHGASDSEDPTPPLAVAPATNADAAVAAAAALPEAAAAAGPAEMPYAPTGLQPQHALLLPQLLQLQDAATAAGAAPAVAAATAGLQLLNGANGTADPSSRRYTATAHTALGQLGQQQEQRAEVVPAPGAVGEHAFEVRAQWAVLSWDQQQQQPCTTPSGPELPADSTLLGMPALQQQQQQGVLAAAEQEQEQLMINSTPQSMGVPVAAEDADGATAAAPLQPAVQQQAPQLQQPQQSLRQQKPGGTAAGGQHQNAFSRYSLRDARREAKGAGNSRGGSAGPAAVNSKGGSNSRRAAVAAGLHGSTRPPAPAASSVRRPATAKGLGRKPAAAAAAAMDKQAGAAGSVDMVPSAGAEAGQHMPADAAMCPEATAAGVAVAGRVCGSLAGIASSLSALQQQVQQHNNVMVPAGGLMPTMQGALHSVPLQHEQAQHQRQQQGQQQEGVRLQVEAPHQGMYALPTAANVSQQGLPLFYPPGIAAANSSGSRQGSSTRLAAGPRASAAVQAAAVAGHSSSSRSPVKVAAGVQAQLADYQVKLLQLRSSLQSAALPWTNPAASDTSCHSSNNHCAGSDSQGAADAAGPALHTVGDAALVAAPAGAAGTGLAAGALAGAAWRAGTAVVLRPRSPEAIQVSNPVSPCAQPPQRQQWQQWPAGVTGEAVPEWRLEGQPRSSSLVPAAAMHSQAAGADADSASAEHDHGLAGPAGVGAAAPAVVQQLTEPGVMRFARLC